MGLSLSEQALINSVRAVQGLQLYEEDIRALALLQSELQQQQNRIVDIEGVEHQPFDPSIRNGKLAGSIVGGLIGIGLSFAIPGVGLALGFAIGSTIGGLLGGLLSPPVRRKDEKFAPSVGVDSGGSLTQIGGTIPLVFGNREINRSGGARVTGFLINSKILTRQGAQYLYQLYTLGVGPFGEVDPNSLLIENQSLSNFLADEVTTTIRLGTADQTVIDDFQYYSQSVSPSTNSYFGLSRRDALASISTVENTFAQFSQAVYVLIEDYGSGGVTTNRITKTTPNAPDPADGWNAGAFGLDPIEGGGTGFFYFLPSQSNKYLMAGLSTTNPDSDYASIEYALFLKAEGNYAVYYQGQLLYASTDTYLSTDYFLFLIKGNKVFIQKNSTIIYQFTQIPQNANYYIDTSFYNVGAEINTIKVGNTINGGSTSVSQLDMIQVSQDAFESFTPSERYRVGTHDFRVITKNRNNFKLTISPALPLSYAAIDINNDQVSSDRTVYSVYKANYETSKHVSFVDFNFSCSLFKRKSKDNAVQTLYSMFDLYIRRLGTSSFSKVGRFLLSGRNPNGSRRALRVQGLPLDKYFFEFRILGQTGANDTDPIYLIDDTNNICTINAVVLGGISIQVQIESGGSSAGVPKIFSNNDANNGVKITDTKNYQYSAESGPVNRITSVNECLNPADIGLTADIMRYAGFVMVGYKLLASDRISSAPQTSVIVRKGLQIRNHMAAGTAAASSSAGVLSDPAQNFTAFQVGWRIRNLTRHLEGPITALTQATLTDGAIPWTTGDRYLVYFVDSSPYFADHYVFAIANKKGGLGNYIDGDYFVDYPGICDARQFQVTNALYYDTSLTQSTNFTDWANQSALRSLCLPGRTDGRFGLTPEREPAVTGIFNAARVQNVQYDYAAWSEQAVNRISATWYDGSDGKFNPKSCLVQTIAANAASEPVVEETLDLIGVNNPEQAKRVSQVYLKTRRLQDRTVSFETDIAALSVRPGDLFIFNHPTVEYNFEVSGWVYEVGAFVTGTQTIQISQVVDTTTPLNYRAAVQFRESETVQLDIPITINADESITLTGLTNPIAVGDVVIIGSELVTRNTYRATNIKPQINKNQISITGVLRPSSILDTTGLVTICDPPAANPPIIDFSAS